MDQKHFGMHQYNKQKTAWKLRAYGFYSLIGLYRSLTTLTRSTSDTNNSWVETVRDRAISMK